MGFSAKEFFKNILRKGIWFEYSTGPMFDPTYQKRTDAVEDIVKSKTKKEGGEMGIMESWEKWSLKQYEKWGSKLQNKYDKYRNLKTPDWYLKLTDTIWDKLDVSTKKFLNTLIEETVKAFDEEFAKELLDKIIKAIKKKLAI